MEELNWRVKSKYDEDKSQVVLKMKEKEQFKLSPQFQKRKKTSWVDYKWIGQKQNLQEISQLGGGLRLKLGKPLIKFEY